jgi:hypothetical protein
LEKALVELQRLRPGRLWPVINLEVSAAVGGVGTDFTGRVNFVFFDFAYRALE